MADPELIGKGKGRIDPVFVTADGFAKSDFLIPAHYRDDLEKVHSEADPTSRARIDPPEFVEDDVHASIAPK